MSSSHGSDAAPDPGRYRGGVHHPPAPAWSSVTAQQSVPAAKPGEGPKGLLNEARWAEIVAAAAEVFHEKGYGAATLQEIASRVGLLKGSLYYYIESKEDLLFAVIEAEYTRGLSTLVEDEATAAADPPTRLAEFIRRWMRVSLATLPQRSSVLVHETRHLGPERLGGIMEQRKRIHAFVRDLLLEGIETGDFDASVHPGVAANTLFEIMDGAQQWYKESGSLSVSDIAEWDVAFFLRGVTARAPAVQPVRT
jgi:TetR/AcrR family transcriptional regulator, cholesterol catabolism regulator